MCSHGLIYYIYIYYKSGCCFLLRSQNPIPKCLKSLTLITTSYVLGVLHIHITLRVSLLYEDSFFKLLIYTIYYFILHISFNPQLIFSTIPSSCSHYEQNSYNSICHIHSKINFCKIKKFNFFTLLLTRERKNNKYNV